MESNGRHPLLLIPTYFTLIIYSNLNILVSVSGSLTRNIFRQKERHRRQFGQENKILCHKKELLLTLINEEIIKPDYSLNLQPFYNLRLFHSLG